MSARTGSTTTDSGWLARPRMLIPVVLALVAALLFSGRPARADQPVSFAGPEGATPISLIGDSTLTGVRWYENYGDLRQYRFILNAESCRRTIGQSCISREGYRSETVLAAMNTHDGDLGEVLVVMSGYNDPDWTIDDSISLVTDEARSQGVDHVVWLTLRTSHDVDYSDPQEGSSINTFRLYNEALTEAAATSGGFLQVADWASWSHGATSWFEADGVHLTTTGVDALTSYVATIVDRVLAGENVSPEAAPWTILVPGAEGETVEAVQTALLDSGIEVRGGADGIYGNSTMTAVAAYQEQHGDLQVTGAVDGPTALALGVHPDSPGPTAETGGETRPDDAVTADDVAAIDQEARPAAAESDESSLTRAGSAVAVGLVVLLAAALVMQRRRVVRRRKARRWARVHPSTSPHRSVADLRRSGELPVVPYDHEAEPAAAHEPDTTAVT